MSIKFRNRNVEGYAVVHSPVGLSTKPVPHVVILKGRDVLEVTLIPVEDRNTIASIAVSTEVMHEQGVDAKGKRTMYYPALAATYGPTKSCPFTGPPP